MSASDAGALLGEKYRLERVLARGRSAVVWEASHVMTNRTVAVKLFVEPMGALPRARERMLLEARISSLAPHPNLLPVDDVLELPDGRAALVMERLMGESLRARIEHRPLTLEEVARLFGPALEALQGAHAAGLVHRDLKPDNLFVTDSPERLVVLDFGIAKLLGETALDLTSTGVSMGTPFYMAPEQLFGDADIDSRADVWALGVVLFEALTGRRPTEAGNLGQLLKLVSSRSVPRLEASEIGGHAAFAAVVNRMLDVRREHRPGLDEVRRVLTGDSTRAEPPRARWRWPVLTVGLIAASAMAVWPLVPRAPLRASRLAVVRHAVAGGEPAAIPTPAVAPVPALEPVPDPRDARRAANHHASALPSKGVSTVASAPATPAAPAVPPLHEGVPF